jgi:hypothetical protein
MTPGPSCTKAILYKMFRYARSGISEMKMSSGLPVVVLEHASEPLPAAHVAAVDRPGADRRASNRPSPSSIRRPQHFCRANSSPLTLTSVCRSGSRVLRGGRSGRWKVVGWEPDSVADTSPRSRSSGGTVPFSTTARRIGSSSQTTAATPESGHTIAALPLRLSGRQALTRESSPPHWLAHRERRWSDSNTGRSWYGGRVPPPERTSVGCPLTRHPCF